MGDEPIKPHLETPVSADNLERRSTNSSRLQHADWDNSSDSDLNTSNNFKRNTIGGKVQVGIVADDAGQNAQVSHKEPANINKPLSKGHLDLCLAFQCLLDISSTMPELISSPKLHLAEATQAVLSLNEDELTTQYFLLTNSKHKGNKESEYEELQHHEQSSNADIAASEPTEGKNWVCKNKCYMTNVMTESDIEMYKKDFAAKTNKSGDVNSSSGKPHHVCGGTPLKPAVHGTDRQVKKLKKRVSFSSSGAIIIPDSVDIWKTDACKAL